MKSSRPDHYTFESPYQHFGNTPEVVILQNEKPRRFSCCFCGCILGCFGFLLIPIIGIAFFVYCILAGSVPLVVSPETTVITGPLKSDGKSIDYRQALQDLIKADIQPDDNGFRDVFLGYGKEVFSQQEDHEQHFLALCKELNVDPEVQATLVLPPLEETANNLEQWLADVSPGLDSVQTAVAKPHYFIPFLENDGNNLAALSSPRTIYEFHERLANAFWMRADIRLKSGNMTGYWQDTLTQIQLFRRVAFNQTWLKALIGDGDESALPPTAEIARTLSQWTPEQLSQAITDLESLPQWQDPQTSLKMIQFMLLDIISTMSSPNTINETADVQNRFPGMPLELERIWRSFQIIAFDWNLVTKELNTEIKNYGDLLSLAADKSLDEQFELLNLRSVDETKNDFLERFFNERDMEKFMINFIESHDVSEMFFASGRSKLMGSLVGRKLVTWAAGEMYRLQLMEESRCQALRLVLALERFHRDNEHYPETLDELRLKPMDRNLNLQYEKSGDGYRLHNKVFQIDTK